MQLAAIIVSIAITVVAVALFGRATAQIYRFVRLGQPVPATRVPVTPRSAPSRWSRSSSATHG